MLYCNMFIYFNYHHLLGLTLDCKWCRKMSLEVQTSCGPYYQIGNLLQVDPFWHLAKIPWEQHRGHFWSAFADLTRWWVALSILMSWMHWGSTTQRDRAVPGLLLKDNVAKMSTSSLSWLHSLTDKHRSFCPWALRRFFRLWGVQVSDCLLLMRVDRAEDILQLTRPQMLHPARKWNEVNCRIWSSLPLSCSEFLSPSVHVVQIVVTVSGPLPDLSTVREDSQLGTWKSKKC